MMNVYVANANLWIFCWASGALGTSGNSGQQGQISKVTSENILLESTQETYYQNTNGFCGAGVGGSGGKSGGCALWLVGTL